MAKKTAPTSGSVARRSAMPVWEYAPAPESAAIGRIKPRYQMFVGGRFVDGRGGDVPTINPATE
jgi:aldehyde dehydrogenase (NAD+)